MTSRGGRERDRFRRDYPMRSEEKSHGRNNPPSRHLWVGNLAQHITENTLANHFLQFGELESIAFQPGRSYAFINFKNEDEAFAAIRELQGFVLAGNPIRIEFTKAVSVVHICLSSLQCHVAVISCICRLTIRDIKIHSSSIFALFAHAEKE
ncbi:unnamed protein product [Ilex paraguariensis]|uniref:RRM domain-containing protein n=1 Tax=Ilex paraguariensis TaxID=185542 RepID=A0ABC8SST3_9AQUA